MILVANDIGSRERLDELRDLGLDAELAELAFADFAFEGQGPGGKSVSIGIELKRMNSSDFLKSLQSGRFVGHQLPGLCHSYDYLWLVTEGLVRANPHTGVLEVFTGTWAPQSVSARPLKVADIDAWIVSVQVLAFVRFGRSLWRYHADRKVDTGRFVHTLYHWWNDKAFEAHRALDVLYQPPPSGRASFIEPSTFRRMVANIPKVGWEKSEAIETYCGGNFATLVGMTPEQLQEIEGIGPVIAANIHAALTGAL